jgi:putative ABC transport system permease protein
MIRHLVRLIWNRKRQNLLLSIEIFCSFLVVFVVLLVGLNFAVNASKPLGYQIDRVWSIDMGRPRGPSGDDKGPAAEEARARERDTVARLLAAVRELPQVEVATPAFTAPYINSTWGSGVDLADGRHVDYLYNRVGDDFTTVFSMPIVAGRSFSRVDDGAGADPVLINVRAARLIFGDANPIGKIIPQREEPNRTPRPADPPVKAKRVVGVIEEFRQHGKYSVPEPVLMDRMRVDVPDGGSPERLLIRVKPGTTVAFEPVLVRRLQREAAAWSFEVSTMEHLRERNHSDYLMPLAVLSVIAGFLLLMVVLGMTGVIWQNVTVRLREFGLRRAAGASGASVRRQVFAELAVMTSFAVLTGAALLAQVPFLPLPNELLVIVAPGVFLSAVALAAAAIYCLTLACGWYPSRLAARIPPADALRYE